SLNFKTSKEKEKPSIIFSDADIKSTSAKVKASLYDVDDTAIITSVLKGKIKLQKLDSGNYVDVEGSEQELTSISQLQNVELSYTQLTSNMNYRIVVESYYTLTTSENMVFEVIGQYDFTTSQVDPVAAVLTVIEYDTITNSAKVNITFTTNNNTLMSGNLQLVNSTTGALVGNPIVLTSTDFETLSESTGMDFVFDSSTIGVNLASNTEYKVQFTSVLDDGANAVNVNVDDNSVFTRKQIVQADTVLTTLSNDMELSAIIGRAPNEVFVDTDKSITKIEYSIYNVEDLDTALKTVVVNNVDKYKEEVVFDLTDAELGKGNSYIVKAVVSYNDNYDDDTLELQSTQQDAERELPTVKYEFISKDSTQTVIKVHVTDDDGSIVAGSLTLKTDTGDNALTVGDNTITVTGNPTSFVTEADIQQLEGNVVPSTQLQTASLLNTKNEEAELESGLTYKHSVKGIEFNFANISTFTKNSSLYTNYKIVEDDSGEIVLEKKLSGTSQFTKQTISLPTDELLFDNTYDLSTEGEVYYTKHEVNNNFNSIVTLALSDNSKYVGLSGNATSLYSSVVSASAYEIIGGSYNASTGSVTGAKLKNVRTGNYLNTDMGRVVENTSSSASIDFTLQDNGSYTLSINGQYTNLTSGALVIDEQNASKINVYQVTNITFDNQETITTDPLLAPTVTVTNFQIYDGSIDFNYSFTDADGTLLWDSLNNVYDAKIIVRDTSDNSEVASVNIEYLSKNGNVIDTLVSNTQYTIEIVGKYNLKDGQGDHEEVFYTNTFRTQVILPTATASEYTWNNNPCGIVGTNGKLTYSDSGNVGTNVKYVWYKKPSGSYDLTNLDQMRQVLSSNEGLKGSTFTFDITDNPSNEVVSLPMFGGPGFANRKYEIGNYLIAAYIETSLSDTPEVLVNVGQINITAPTLNEATLSSISRTETSATYQFSYTDPNGVLGCTNKQFEVALYKVVGSTKTLVDNTTQQYTRNTETGYVDLPFTGLEPNTTYEVVFAATSYNNLTTIGRKEYKATFTTLNQFVISSAPVMEVNGTNVNVTVNNLNHNSSTLNDIKINLYYWTSQADMSAGNPANVITNTIAIPGSFPTNLSTSFTISQTGYYYAEIVVDYTKDDGGGNDQYKLRSDFIYPVTLSARSLSITKEENTLTFNDIDSDITKLEVIDQDGTTIETIEVSENTASVTIPKETRDIRVDAIDVNEEVESVYYAEDVNQAIYVVEHEGELKLVSSDFMSDETVVSIKVTENLGFLDSFVSFFTGDNIHTTETKLKSLNEGIVLPYSIEDDIEIEVTDKDGNNYVVVWR
ncbi:MAG: hypothetical protein ACK5LC_18650, partial [Coprobacillaceae bacterium]